MKKFLKLITNILADHGLYGADIDLITDGTISMSWYDFVERCELDENQDKSPNKKLVFIGRLWWIDCEYSVHNGYHWVYHKKPFYPRTLYEPDTLKLTE